MTLQTNPDLCPTGCGRLVASGHLMCRPCWYRVPKPLQADVYRTLRTWRAGDYEAGDAAKAYRAARDAAIASVP